MGIESFEEPALVARKIGEEGDKNSEAGSQSAEVNPAKGE